MEFQEGPGKLPGTCRLWGGCVQQPVISKDCSASTYMLVDQKDSNVFPVLCELLESSFDGTGLCFCGKSGTAEMRRGDQAL